MLRAPSRPPDRRPPAPGDRAVSTAPPGQRTGRFRPSRKLLAGAGIGLAVALAALAGTIPIIRGRVAREAARRKLDVNVGSVRPGFFAVTLRDVHVKPEGIPEIDVHLEEVRVDLSASLGVREVTVRGGDIALSGEPEELAEKVRTFRKSGGGEEGSAHGPRMTLAMNDVALAWKLPTGGEIAATGLRAARGPNGTSVGCGRCTGTHRNVTLVVTDGDVVLGADNSVQKVSAKALDVVYEPPRSSLPAAPPTTSAEPAFPPLPPAQARGKKGSKPPAGAPIAAPEEPVLPLPDLHAMRAKIAAVAVSLGDRLPDGMTADIGGLSAKIDVGGDAVAFGPGAFSLSRRAEVVHVSFASERGDAGKSTPLSLDAEIPLVARDVTARLSGGPVSLGSLGVKEGTKGLFDVGRGTISGKGQLVLAANGESLTFDGRVELRDVSLKNPRLAPGAVRGIELAASARGLLDDAGRLRIDDSQLDMGALHVRTHGNVEETRDHFALSLGVDVAPAACQALLDATPRGLLPTVQTMRMTGTFGGTARVVFDTRAIDKLVLDYQIDDRCRVHEVPRELSRDRFSGSFSYRTYHPDGTPSETTTGPGSSSWTDLENISPYMTVAVLTTEDGAFYKHHGFNHGAIRNSVAANLKARRFVRGASTITMQLAKNLFLSREKTLSRKIEEVILTDYLEQVFRKDDLMELYLNVIEFGPDVYGVTNAAEHYFGRRPDELSLPECFFLATLLPSPVRYGKGIREKGQVPDGWMKTIRGLMEIAGKHNKVTPAELTEALTQDVKLLRPGDPRPERRRGVPGSRRDGYDDDVGWQPLD